MDAHSMSCASSSRRFPSRIYDDFKAIRRYTAQHLHAGQAGQSVVTFHASKKARMPHSERKPHIGVVGAGLAGLRCVDILLRHGFQVTLLEGRQRLGGRVHQVALQNGKLADMGPNWIHGTKDNPILDLAKYTGTTVGSWDTRSYVFDEHGDLLPLGLGEKYSTVMWEIIGEAFKFSNKHSNEINSEKSLYDFFVDRIQEAFPEGTGALEKHCEIVMQMAELWGAFVGSPLKRQSLKFFWLEECVEGENLFCAGTYKKILDTVAEPAIRGATIRYGTTVTRIGGKPDEKGTVEVATASGETLQFDEVVLTTPLGWLKKNLEAFDPPLPPRLSQAIHNISYGSLEKVYISFPKAFWLVPDEKEHMFHGFCQWLAPNYAPDSNPHRWTQEIVELGSLAGDSAHPTLLFYIYGDQSQHLTDAVSKLPTKDKKDEYLYEFFRPYYSRLPRYDAQDPNCQPTGCLATDWLHDDLAGNGSYTNFQVGLEEGDQDIRAMRHGVPERGLWLAGEHTAPFVGLATATGAYWSGEVVARRIAEAYGLEKAAGATQEQESH